MRIFAYVCLGIVVLVALVALSWVMFFARQGGRIVEKTFDADNVIYNYEWFHDQHQLVLAAWRKTAVAESAVGIFKADAGPREGWTFEDKQESARLGANLVGLRNHVESLVAEYNARSKMVNRKIFKGKLPVTIEGNAL